MAKERVRIVRDSLSKEQFERVVNRNFTTFIKEDPNAGTDTVGNFFRLYEKLYYSIPVEGETNSHEYLIRKSSELIDIEKNTEDIQPLLDEIALLRERLLEANQQILNLETQGING